MTDQPYPSMDDARQADRLDAWLDGLAHGDPNPPINLDPSLATTVRHVHALAHEGVAADIRRADKAQRWEDLMRSRIAQTTVTPFPMATTLLASSAPPPVPLPPAVSPSRLRRWGGRSLGLVATLTLVLLVAASGLAVYLSAPGGGEPTILPAAFGGSPAATPSNANSDVDPAFIAEYPDLAVPYLETCDVSPRTLEELTAILGAPIQPNRQGTPRLQLLPTIPRPTVPPSLLGRYDSDGLAATPVGTEVDRDIRLGITGLWGRYRSCDLSHETRRAAVYMSDGALLRLVYADGFNLEAISALSAEPRTGDRLPRFNQPDQLYLANFRLIGADHVMADVLIERSNPQEGKRLEVNAHVIFVHVNNIWLVDEIQQFYG